MLLIYSSRNSERLIYTCKFIFADYYGLPFEICHSEEEFQLWDGAKLNYSEKPLLSSLQIFPHGLLFEEGVRVQTIEVFRNNGFPAFFKTAEQEVSFDIFSAVFYLISRYEEYLPHTADSHGRFKAESSLAYRADFLTEPIVETWLAWLREILHTLYQMPGFKQRKFSSISTIDVDQAFSYKHKGAIRNFSGLLWDAAHTDFDSVMRRVKVLRGKEEDPFNNFEYILASSKEYGCAVIFFLLLAEYGKFDKGISPSNPELQMLIKDLNLEAATGIHPSYYSSEKPELMQKEIQWLSYITDAPVQRSRQHYLRMSLPLTYRHLIANGITEDHTMGYAGSPGFRAGVSVPFYFYDLEKEQATELLLCPFVVMDVSLRDYLKLSPENSIQIIRELIGKVKKVNGTFVSLWHNESLSEVSGWKGWRKVYEEMLKIASLNNG